MDVSQPHLAFSLKSMIIFSAQIPVGGLIF